MHAEVCLSWGGTSVMGVEYPTVCVQKSVYPGVGH